MARRAGRAGTLKKVAPGGAAGFYGKQASPAFGTGAAFASAFAPVEWPRHYAGHFLALLGPYARTMRCGGQHLCRCSFERLNLPLFTL